MIKVSRFQGPSTTAEKKQTSKHIIVKCRNTKDKKILQELGEVYQESVIITRTMLWYPPDWCWGCS